MASLYGTEGQNPGIADPLAKTLIKLLEKSHPDTATTTSVAAATSSTLLKAENDARKGVTVFNDTDKTLYLGGTTVTTSAFIVKVDAGGYYEFPFGYVGAVYGIWASGPTGSARVTEFT